MTRIAAAILAAGTSSRLGTPKQLLELGGLPVLSHTLAAVAKSSVDVVMVVLGHAKEQIQQRVDLSNVVVIDNPDFATGQSSSVRAVVRSLPDDIDAAVFVLGDQPLVQFEVIDALVAARRKLNPLIVQPRYAEGRGNPILIGRELFGELLALEGDVGARPLLRLHGSDVTLVDVSDHQRPADIDTVEDYQALQQQFESLRKHAT